MGHQIVVLINERWSLYIMCLYNRGGVSVTCGFYREVVSLYSVTCGFYREVVSLYCAVTFLLVVGDILIFYRYLQYFAILYQII